MERTLKPLNGYKDMEWAIQKAGAWFIGSFMVEFVDSYEQFQNKNTKEDFLDYFMKEFNEYCQGTGRGSHFCRTDSKLLK